MRRLWLFGRVRFQVDDGPVTHVKPERAQRLLAFMALESRGERGGTPHRRARIVGELWAGSEAQRPENSLVQALRDLRQVLGSAYSSFVVEDGDRVSIHPDVWVDALAFDSLAESDPATARELTNRPLLEYVDRSGSAWDHARRDEFEAARRALPTGPARSEERASSDAPRPRAAPSRGPLIGAAAAALLGLVIVGVLVAGLAAGGDERAGGGRCPDDLATPDAADAAAASARERYAEPRPGGRVAVGERPASLAVGREGVWVAERRGVTLIDPRRLRQAMPVIAVADRPSADNAPFSIALSRTRLWVARRDGVLVSIDRATRRLTGPRVRYGAGAATVALAGDAVWVNNFQDRFDGSGTRIDPCSGRLSRLRAGRGANTVYAAFGAVWVTNSVDGALERIDPVRRRKAGSILGLDDPQDVVAVGQELWVTQYAKRTVVRIDPRRGRVIGRPIRVGPDPAGLAVGAGRVWVPLYGNGTLTAVDPRSASAVLGAARVGASPTDAVVGFGRVWVPNNDGDTVTAVVP